MNDKLEKDLEGNSRSLIEILRVYQNLPGRAEENTQICQDRRCPGRYSKRTPTKYKSRASSPDQRGPLSSDD
jgi:hypothetical protein